MAAPNVGELGGASCRRPVHVLAEAAPLVLRDCLCTFVTVGHVFCCQAVCRRWWRLSRETKWVKHCVLSGGVAAAERRGLWGRLAAVPGLQARWRARVSEEEAAGSLLGGRQAFEVLASRALPHGKVAEIERDVHRTFPTHPLFKGPEGDAGRSALLQVLRAAFAAEPGVGYCQGMNFVAATLIISLGNANDAFWILLAMIEGYYFRHVFCPGVPLLPLRVYQFSCVVRRYLPRLWRHLNEESSSLEIFAQQCVLTLFAYSIDPSSLVYIYDVFFLLGWKAVFRVGLGLLASMEEQLLVMEIEEISRFLHQNKWRLEAGAPGGGNVQNSLSKLLRFKVSHTFIDELQHAFQVERWEVCLDRAGDGGRTGDNRPLPIGLQRSASGSSFVMDMHALATGNRPPWRLVDRAAGPPPDSAAQHGPVRVPMDALRQLKAELDEFDAETYRDIGSLRTRIAEVDRELAMLLRDTETLRDEVEESGAERQEWQEYKKALMDALHEAVKTSPLVRADDRHDQAPTNGNGATSRRQPAQDALVAQCLAKVKELESEIFERSLVWKSKERELEPFVEQIEELREVKVRSMAQLGEFITVRMSERLERLEAGLRRHYALK